MKFETSMRDQRRSGESIMENVKKSSIRHMFEEGDGDIERTPTEMKNINEDALNLVDAAEFSSRQRMQLAPKTKERLVKALLFQEGYDIEKVREQEGFIKSLVPVPDTPRPVDILRIKEAAEKKLEKYRAEVIGLGKTVRAMENRIRSKDQDELLKNTKKRICEMWVEIFGVEKVITAMDEREEEVRSQIEQKK